MRGIFVTQNLVEQELPHLINISCREYQYTNMIIIETDICTGTKFTAKNFEKLLAQREIYSSDAKKYCKLMYSDTKRTMI